MPKDTAERVLRPGEADGHFARVYVAVVRVVAAVAAKVDAAVGGTHVGHADAEHVLFANLDGLLGLENERRVGTEMRAEQLTVEPDGRVSGDAFETQENTLCDLFFVFDSETLEVERAVLGQKQLFKRPFPNVGNRHRFRIFGVGGVPAVGDAGIFRIPFHLPIAIETQNIVHVGSFMKFSR